MRSKALINDFAIRSFRDTADVDYIAARMAFRVALLQQFFWSSQQAVEKYIKCILLLNRIPAQKMRHNLRYGLDKINNEGKFKLRLSLDSHEFIQRLNMYGSHRYFETSYYSLGLEILSLDRTVWELRRYCAVLDYCVEKSSGERKEMLEIELRRIEQSENDSPPRFVLAGGFLEKVIKDRESQAREALLFKNLFFGTSRENLSEWAEDFIRQMHRYSCTQRFWTKFGSTSSSQKALSRHISISHDSNWGAGANRLRCWGSARYGSSSEPAYLPTPFPDIIEAGQHRLLAG